MKENISMHNAIESLGIKSPAITQLSGGEVNETYSIKDGEQRYVLQFMYPSNAPEYHLLTAYAHPDRGAKIGAVLSYLAENGISVPKVVEIAKDSPASWIITSWAEGENLENLYSNLNQGEKLLVARNMAKFLAKIHTLPVSEELRDIIYPEEKPNLEETFLRNQERTDKIVRTLYDKGIITRDTLTKVLGWYKQHEDTLPHGQTTFVHRDFFQRNVFVDPESLEIKSVIDWGDTADIDDPIKDAVLAAWWIADNFDTQENKDIFQAFLEEYNLHVPRPVNLEQASQILDIYNLQWYLELVLHNESIGNKAAVVKFLESVNKLINI